MNWFPFWPLLGLLAVAAILPLAASLFRPPAARGRREADLALYRAQMEELDREREAGRLDETAHRAAVLEVQRRLLAAPAEAGTRSGRGAKLALWGTVAAVPLLALALYWPSALPDMPSAPFALRQQIAARDEEMLELLRSRLATLNPASQQAQDGYRLLGNAERSRGALGPAAEAFKRALAAKFDPELMSQLAQILIEDDKLDEARRILAAGLPQAPQHVGLRFLSGLVEAKAGHPERARELWQALVAAAPPEAPWRTMVERRMQELP